MIDFPHRFAFKWRRPAVRTVTSARDFRWPRVMLNRYPGIVIGVAAYYRHRGLSLLWGRPGGVRA